MKIVEARDGSIMIREFEKMTPEKRPRRRDRVALRDPRTWRRISRCHAPDGTRRHCNAGYSSRAILARLCPQGC